MTYIGSAQHKTRTALLELTMLLGLLLTQTVHAAPATMFSPVNGATFASTSRGARQGTVRRPLVSAHPDMVQWQCQR